jgi:hypothetical protein|tara:strand:+ start:2171 stop:2758 length:588 start_codon:yes stop_codon:yes gene_type:complete
MALTYPLSTPTTIGIESIELRAVNAVAVSQSPFTYKQQVISHGGQKWEAAVNIPSVHRDKAAEWKAMLVGLKGQVGTFLLGDPDYATPQGTVSSCTLSGTAGDETVTVVMTGTLKAGDYIQLGAGSSAKLHQVLLDQDGDGSLEIWPSLRADYTDATVTFDDPKGVFRLGTNITSWSINNASAYGISFEAVEALT